MQAYQDLMAHQRQTQALAQISGRLGWDQETMMPQGAAAQRAEESAALQTVIHARRTDPCVGDWLAALSGADLPPEAAANIRHIQRDWDKARRLPADLVAALARQTSLSQQAWAQCKTDENVAGFLPFLTDIITLKRQEAAALQTPGQSPYDALIDDYEPMMRADDLAQMFAALRPRLADLRARLKDRTPAPMLQGHFPKTAQLELSQRLALAFGYDLTRGRIDLAVHPFSSGSGTDVRITTRVDEADPFNCLYSTIHEVGHACYEQNIIADYALTPLGQGVSMGVHESQSRIYENQLGRSRAFCNYLYREMTARFGDMGLSGADEFYDAVNALRDGYIRTEADEVQYNLHVLLRFDLERALFEGDLSSADLEAAWNDRFAADFGFAVDRPSHGLLQDVHWSCGLFGYFATYSLGNLYAGSLHKALRADLPDLDSDLERGHLTGATDWLAQRVQRFGGLKSPHDTITQACGFAPDATHLLDYLEEKFTG